MKKISTLLFFAAMLASCSKISQDRLEGTWQVTEIEEIPTDIFDLWQHWLDTTEVKAAFFKDETMKVFYFEDSLVGLSGGSYTLLEDDAKLLIDDTSFVFNSHGLPLDIVTLRKSKMILEGRYYLHGIDESIPVDSFRTLRWTLEQ